MGLTPHETSWLRIDYLLAQSGLGGYVLGIDSLICPLPICMNKFQPVGVA